MTAKPDKAVFSLNDLMFLLGLKDISIADVVSKMREMLKKSKTRKAEEEEAVEIAKSQVKMHETQVKDADDSIRRLEAFLKKFE